MNLRFRHCQICPGVRNDLKRGDRLATGRVTCEGLAQVHPDNGWRSGLERKLLSRTSAAQPKAPWRHELDGLRTIAIMLVMGFHIWGTGVSGGVDIFFVISGYLVVQRLDAKLRRHGSFNLAEYWGRTFYRLLLPVGVLLCAVIVACFYFLPMSRWPDLLPQFHASALGFQNLWLAHTAVDYYAGRSVFNSPVQHLWSISLQTQVFIILPIIIWFTWRLVNRCPVRLTPALTTVLAAVAVMSLGAAVTALEHDPVPAYFWTTTRLWEFALGGLAGLVPALGASRGARNLATAVGWLCVVTITVGPFLWSSQTRFPGFTALIPTTAAAVFLVMTRRSGNEPAPSWWSASLERVMGVTPLRYAGRQALGLYLWHWPLLVFFTTRTGTTRPSVTQGLAIIVTAAFLSLLTGFVPALFDKLVAGFPRARLLGLAGMATIVAAVVTGAHVAPRNTPTTSSILSSGEQGSDSTDTAPEQTGLASQLDRSAGADSQLSDPDETAGPRPVPSVASTGIIPSPAEVRKSWHNVGPLCARKDTTATLHRLKACRKPAEARSEAADWVIVGDSHAQQYGAAVQALASEHDAQVRSFLLGKCRYPAVTEIKNNYRECRQFVRDVKRNLAKTKPDVIFLVGTKSLVDAPGEEPIPGLAQELKVLTSQGAEVVLIRDNPRFSFNPYECGELRGWDSDTCVRRLRQGTPDENPNQVLAESTDHVHAVDHLLEMCPERRCAPVQGNIAVFMDDNHLSTPFARSLVTSLRRQLEGTAVLNDDPARIALHDGLAPL